MIKTFDLTNQTILVTGGYGHLGKAVSESLVHHGAWVFVLARSKDKFEAAFGGHPEIGKRLKFQHCDISSSESIRQAFANVNQEAGRLDVLINNSVYSKGQSPETMTDEEWSFGVDGTLNSVFKCIREVIPYFKGKGSGKIINVSSMYGVVAPDFSIYEESPEFLNPPHYGAAKAGVIQLTKYYASYLGHLGITVNCVTPGPFPSARVQQSQKFVDELKAKTMLNKIGTPEDLAGSFVFLSSAASDFITGQNIVVDGGWTAR